MSEAFSERIARILVETAKEVPTEDFAKLLERVLSGLSTSVVAAIADHLPEQLQALLPRKCLH
jgi:hypothetical protein